VGRGREWGWLYHLRSLLSSLLCSPPCIGPPEGVLLPGPYPGRRQRAAAAIAAVAAIALLEPEPSCR
jgi:hypothetical protein